MNKEMEETVLKAVDYSNTEAEHINRRVRICNAAAMFLILLYTIVKGSSLYENLTVRNCMDFTQGLAVGMLFVGLLFSSKYGVKIRAFKQRLMKRQS